MQNVGTRAPIYPQLRYSYPALAEGAGGAIHLAYTFNREVRIEHAQLLVSLRFSLECSIDSVLPARELLAGGSSCLSLGCR